MLRAAYFSFASGLAASCSPVSWAQRRVGRAARSSARWQVLRLSPFMTELTVFSSRAGRTVDRIERSGYRDTVSRVTLSREYQHSTRYMSRDSDGATQRLLLSAAMNVVTTYTTHGSPT